MVDLIIYKILYNSAMLCPNCKKEMIIIERNNVELDYCMFCEGFWFDFDEWNILCRKLICENLFDNSFSIFNLPCAVSGEKPRICPVCNKKMEKFMIFDILLDRCPDKHGIWFDRSEFSACVNSFNSKSKNSQIEFLGEFFKI